MPNLKAVFDKYPEYRIMCTDTDGHIWSLPWIEQLGSEKTAIQTIDNMSFINKKWLDFLKLDVPTTVDEFEQVLIAFRDNASKLQKEFNIDGSIIPMSCIVNDGGQDPCILINASGSINPSSYKECNHAIPSLYPCCVVEQITFKSSVTAMCLPLSASP